jgi:hypothetical protein
MIARVTVFRGDDISGQEIRERDWSPGTFSFTSDPFDMVRTSKYYRLEIETSGGDAYGRQHLALTNPTWANDT